MPNPEHEFRNHVAGITIRIVTGISNDSVKNDGFAYGAMLADLQREGWHLKSLERTGDGLEVKADLNRTWTLAGAQRREGPPETMGIAEYNAVYVDGEAPADANA